MTMSVVMAEIEERNADGARQATPAEMSTLIAGALLGHKRGWLHREGAEQTEVDREISERDDGPGITVMELDVDDASVEFAAALAKNRSLTRAEVLAYKPTPEVLKLIKSQSETPQKKK